MPVPPRPQFILLELQIVPGWHRASGDRCNHAETERTKPRPEFKPEMERNELGRWQSSKDFSGKA